MRCASLVFTLAGLAAASLGGQAVDPAPEFNLALAAYGLAPAPLDDSVLEIQTVPGEINVPVTVELSSGGIAGPNGPMGWSIGIENDSCMAVDRVTVEGLSVIVVGSGGAETTLPLRDDCEYPGRLIDSAGVCSEKAAGGAPGVVSYAVLRQAQSGESLRPNASDTVLQIVYKVTVPEEGLTCRAFFSNGLKGSGRPVYNAVTFAGVSQAPTTQGLIIHFTVLPHSGGAFIRGDANDDGRLDIADAVWILLDLFILDAPRTRCTGSGDGNGDGMIDLSDPVYLLDHLFRGGPRPPDPYPSCGHAPDAERCAAGVASCAGL